MSIVHMDADQAMTSSPLVLVAEDESEIAEVLAAYLKRDGYRSVHAPDGRRALELHLALKPDLVLLDVHMPEVDGWKVLAELRVRGSTPVIMLTAMDQDIDKVMGLRMGADDYIVKPFNPSEVAARVQAVLRRCKAAASPATRVIRVAPFEIDLQHHEAVVQTTTERRRLDLTVTELKLLAQLAGAPRRVFTRLELLETSLPEGEALERTVDSHISKLRKKLEDAGVDGVPATVRGIGYKLRLEG